MEIYLDNSATTKPYEEVISVMAEGMREYYGNPSSLHKIGIDAEKKLNESREVISKTINSSKDEIYFTSGGSEGNNLVIKGITKPNHHIITTKFEHHSVLKVYEELEKSGARVTYLNIDSNGMISLEELSEAICKDTVLVSIMYVNNEMGSIQDLVKIGNLIKEKSSRAKFHVDGVQGYGKLLIDVKKMKIDALTVTGHKFHGPKGTGFLYLKKGINLESIIHGGAQESGLRAGTQNVPGIMALAKACEISNRDKSENYVKVLELKRYMIERLKEFDNIRINSLDDEFHSPYILNVSFVGIRGEVILHLLEAEGIYVSTGSACTSKSNIASGSYVIKAMGLCDNEALGAIRFSFSEDNSKEEIDKVIEVLKKSLTFLRRIKR
ncbi:MAG: cysteine desulfurase family protein [Clostridium sp.]|uniref:cysteine desulfurase family protein n=1 Tax=Clostridium sp. TaxID=1506 RepID=UPI003F2D25EE